MLYIVTGAAGHLGNNLVRKLVANKMKVRALVLPNEKTDILDNLGVDVYFGDVTKIETLQPLFELADTNYTYNDVIVVHAAGIISITHKKNKLMETVNVLGTKNMLELSKTYQIRQFLYVSSVHAIKELPKDMMITETDTFGADLVVGAYAKTKAEATKLVIESYNQGFPITIVHPSGIIGPNDTGKGHMTQMIEKYLNKELSTRIRGQYDFVDVRDVADGIYELTKNHHLGTYILSGELITLKRLFHILKKISGRKRKIAVLAVWFVKMFTPLIEWYYRMKKQPPLFTSYSLYTLKSNSNFSHEKATITFGYRPRSIEDTIIDTALWLIEEKRLKKHQVIKFILAHFK